METARSLGSGRLPWALGAARVYDSGPLPRQPGDGAPRAGTTLDLR